MSIVVYPLDNIDFSAEDVGIYNATRSSGIYAGDDFAVSVSGADNVVSVNAGLGWMRLNKFFGVAVASKNKVSVDMGLPDSVYPRIDAVVLQFDAGKNGAEIVAKNGTPSSIPQPPELVRTEALHELHLAHVRRDPGAVSIAVASVTDLRLDPKYCGLMADAVSKIDTEGIAEQIYALIENLHAEIQAVKDGSAYLMRSGGAMEGPIDMGGHALSGLPEPVAESDAARWGEVRAAKATADAHAAAKNNPHAVTAAQTGAVEMKLLWENAAPWNSFAAQPISVDLSGYDYVEIHYRANTSGAVKSQICKVGETIHLDGVTGSSDGGLGGAYVFSVIRQAVVSSTGVAFTKCVRSKQNSTTVSFEESNTSATPHRIIGIKGVT